MASRHQEHSGARIDGTGNWIIKHKTYKEWKSSTGSLLWLRGSCKRSLRRNLFRTNCRQLGAGRRSYGKLILVCCGYTNTTSSRIIEDLQSECIANDDAAILYFYIDGSDHQPLSIDTLYSSFTYQLALQLPGVPYALDKHLGRWHPDDVTSKRRWGELYRDLIEDFSKVYIVIDALDECQDFIELDDIVKVLADLLHQKMRRTNILVSSRPLEQLRRPIQNLNALQVSMEDDAARVDSNHPLSLFLVSSLSKCHIWTLQKVPSLSQRFSSEASYENKY